MKSGSCPHERGWHRCKVYFENKMPCPFKDLEEEEEEKEYDPEESDLEFWRRGKKTETMRELVPVHVREKVGQYVNAYSATNNAFGVLGAGVSAVSTLKVRQQLQIGQAMIASAEKGLASQLANARAGYAGLGGTLVGTPGQVERGIQTRAITDQFVGSIYDGHSHQQSRNAILSAVMQQVYGPDWAKVLQRIYNNPVKADPIVRAQGSLGTMKYTLGMNPKELGANVMNAVMKAEARKAKKPPTGATPRIAGPPAGGGYIKKQPLYHDIIKRKKFAPWWAHVNRIASGIHE